MSPFPWRRLAEQSVCRNTPFTDHHFMLLMVRAKGNAGKNSMKIASLATVLAILQIAIVPVWGADDPGLARLATCRDSWLDWQKTDPDQLKKFGEHFRAEFSRGESDPFFVPRSDTSIAGFRVAQVFPESVGMGVGFSVMVEAKFDAVKQILGKTLGKPLEHCETSDDMRTCELKIADMRTLMVMAEDSATSTTTLIGCYYYYEK
jgi:hypothetical protein